MIRYDDDTILVDYWLAWHWENNIILFVVGSVNCRPKSGSMLLYSRKKVRYRRDGYCWKKRKDGKTTREDHMKLKVQGTEVSVVGGRRIVLFLWRVLACHKFVSGKLSIIFIFKWRLIYSPFPSTTSYSSIQCIYGCYVHSAILPTFHRRCYWLLQVSKK